MQWTDLTEAERVVADHFRTGAELEGTQPGFAVSARALRYILLGGVAAEPGHRAELKLTGAHVEGALEVDFADVDAPITLKGCTFDTGITFFSTHLRLLSLIECEFPGLNVSNATVDGTVALRGCRSTGLVTLGGTTIGGSLLMGGAVFTWPGIAFDSTALRVRRDVLADQGFTCRGAFRIDRAQIDGILSLEGAVLDGSGDAPLNILHAADIAGGGIDDREWSTSVAFSGRHLTARELILLPERTPGGLVDLRHAKVGLLRDAPAAWPSGVRLDGLTYEALSDLDDRDARLDWLRGDSAEFRPQPYAQLAQFYRAAGRDEDARTVLLAGERHRSEKLSRAGRWWGRLQDLTVGYGYRPGRAALWLTLLFVLGTAVFTAIPPRAVEAAKAPGFRPPIYALDLILPVGDFGQQSAYHPRGATAWLAYTLIVAGLILTTTVAAAGARRLRRT